jgi:hypothetical protein
MSEHDIQNSIIDWLQIKGAYVLRVNSGATKVEGNNGKERYIRMAPAGTPDIIACWPGGLFLGIEVKAPGNEPTQKQRETLDLIRTTGGLDVVAYSIDDVEEALDQFIRRMKNE